MRSVPEAALLQARQALRMTGHPSTHNGWHTFECLEIPLGTPCTPGCVAVREAIAAIDAELIRADASTVKD